MSPTVQPAHLAFTLLNEGAGDVQQPVSGQANNSSRTSLFQSVIQKAGGDGVRHCDRIEFAFSYSFAIANHEERSSQNDRPITRTVSSTR